MSVKLWSKLHSKLSILKQGVQKTNKYDEQNKKGINSISSNALLQGNCSRFIPDCTGILRCHQSQQGRGRKRRALSATL